MKDLDLIKGNGRGGLKAYGDVAATLLANGMDTNVLRTNDVLRKDEWTELDEKVVKIARQRLVGVGDLMSRGLVFRIGNGLGTTVLETENMGDLNDAEMSMDAETRAKEALLEFDIEYMPLPIIHKSFSLNVRHLQASRSRGRSLDTLGAEQSSRKVAEYIENLLFNGSSAYTYGGGTLRGYTDHLSRNTIDLTVPWDDSGATGATMLTDLLTMKQASIDAKHLGPWICYLPTNFETALGDDYKEGSDKSILQRLSEIAGIEQIKIADKLASNNVLLVEMMEDTVRMVEGLPLQVIEWRGAGNLRYNFKVLTILLPQIRADQEGNCGITHGS